jgi:hypothetical protein
MLVLRIAMVTVITSAREKRLGAENLAELPLVVSTSGVTSCAQ